MPFTSSNCLFGAPHGIVCSLLVSSTLSANTGLALALIQGETSCTQRFIALRAREAILLRWHGPRKQLPNMRGPTDEPKSTASIGVHANLNVL